MSAYSLRFKYQVIKKIQNPKKLSKHFIPDPENFETIGKYNLPVSTI